jgi:hypothetical protein
VGIDLSDDSGDEGEWYFLYYQQLSILMIFGVLAMKGTIELKTFGWPKHIALLPNQCTDLAAIEGRKVGKKARHDKSATERGTDDEAVARALRAELASLLAQPLQPSFSRRFFAGAGAPGQQPGDAASAGECGKKKKKKARKGEPATRPVEGALALAQKANTALVEGTATANKKAKARVAAAMQAGKSKKRPADPRAAALAAALRRRQEKKSGVKRPGLVVIPRAAFGRETNGPDALQALRQRIAS